MNQPDTYTHDELRSIAALLREHANDVQTSDQATATYLEMAGMIDAVIANGVTSEAVERLVPKATEAIEQEGKRRLRLLDLESELGWALENDDGARCRRVLGELLSLYSEAQALMISALLTGADLFGPNDEAITDAMTMIHAEPAGVH